MARVGLYPDAPKPPCVLGYEVAGEVDAVGEGVREFSPGDRVVAGTRFGGQASLVSVPVNQVLPLAERLSCEQGVNIISAAVGAESDGDLAVMALTTDAPVREETIDAILELDGFSVGRAVSL